MLLLFVGCVLGRTPDPAQTPANGIRLTPVARGLKQVTDIQFHGDRMLVATQTGRLAWVDAKGEAREKVVDVMVAPDGAKGLREMSTVWADQDFDLALPAFYYARVLEVPTPRWNAIDATRYRGKQVEPGVRTKQQERAYTSPIWYAPPRPKAD